MEVINEIRNLYKKFKNPIVTIGTFDGVHLGHQKIIRKVISEAKRLKGTSIVVTFNKRPLGVFSRNKCSDLLMPLPDKIKKIKEMGVKVLIIIKFNKRIAKISAHTFIKNILYEKLRVNELIIGSKFRFGKDRIGDVELLKKMAKKYGFSLKIINEKKYNNTLVSSTRIRHLIKEGSLILATRFLGHPYTIAGYVNQGDRRGKFLGFPTANVKYDTKILVPRGVWVVYLEIENRKYKGICNVGIRPTFQKFENCPAVQEPFNRTTSMISTDLKYKNMMEVHIFNFNRNIYKKYIKITFVKKIRDEKVFSNTNELIRQIKKDINMAQKILSYKLDLKNVA